MYISYEVVIWCVVVKVLSNADQASSVLIFLVSLHLLFIAVSKVHFYFTFDQLSKSYPQFTHTMIIEQVQNISIAFASLATTSQSSYTPIIMILFAVYPLLSLNRNSPSK
jgi:lipoprotein signal peptidase